MDRVWKRARRNLGRVGAPVAVDDQPHALTFFLTGRERAAVLRALRRAGWRGHDAAGGGECGGKRTGSGRAAALVRALRVSARHAATRAAKRR